MSAPCHGAIRPCRPFGRGDIVIWTPHPINQLINQSPVLTGIQLLAHVRCLLGPWNRGAKRHGSITVLQMDAPWLARNVASTGQQVMRTTCPAAGTLFGHGSGRGGFYKRSHSPASTPRNNSRERLGTKYSAHVRGRRRRRDQRPVSKTEDARARLNGKLQLGKVPDIHLFPPSLQTHTPPLPEKTPFNSHLPESRGSFDSLPDGRLRTPGPVPRPDAN